MTPPPPLKKTLYMCFLEPAKIISWVYSLPAQENKLWYLKRIVLKGNK